MVYKPSALIITSPELPKSNSHNSGATSSIGSCRFVNIDLATILTSLLVIMSSEIAASVLSDLYTLDSLINLEWPYEGNETLL